MSFDLKLLDRILVCTKCKGRLVRDTEALVCTVADCRMRYPIEHEIPNMLLEDAALLPVASWESAMQRAGRDGVGENRPASP